MRRGTTVRALDRVRSFRLATLRARPGAAALGQAIRRLAAPYRLLTPSEGRGPERTFPMIRNRTLLAGLLSLATFAPNAALAAYGSK
jgi:hypothetical protein